jgi:hypothetical protein
LVEISTLTMKAPNRTSNPCSHYTTALLIGRGKLIGGDLDVDDEGSEQKFETLQSLHHCSVGYQSMQPKLTSPRRLIPTSAIENTSKNEVDAI